MIAALAMGARILGSYSHGEAAKKGASFVLRRLIGDSGELLHRYRDGHAAIDANANDYAFFILGLLELFKATFEPEYLKKAMDFQERMIEHFWDEDSGGFFLTADTSEELPSRPKELYDGAMPSANSVAFANMFALSRLTGDAKWEEKAKDMIGTFAEAVKRQTSAFSYFLTGLEFALGKGAEVVIAGEANSPEVERMLSAARENFMPNSVVILKTSKNAEKLSELAPFTGPLTPVEGKATAYVCTGFACKKPTSDPEELSKAMKESLEE